MQNESTHEDTNANLQEVTRTKKPLSEDRLRMLANARKKALEVKKMKGELTKAKKAEEQENLKKEYEEKVLKKKKVVSQEPEEESETEKDIYAEMMPSPLQSSVRKKSHTSSPDYKQLYYQQKLQLLQENQKQNEFKQQYSRLSPYEHTVDIAKNSIKNRVDKAVYDQVYKQLFSS